MAARAKGKLPASVNGRVESAVKLVLGGDVFFLDDGTVEVGSASEPLKTYTVAGKACDCQDFAYGRAPQGWCQHRLAVAIQQRVQEQLAAQPPVSVVPEVVAPWPKNDAEGEEPAHVPQAPEPTPVPEAPATSLHGLDPRHIVLIQGKPFVKFAGLLDLAHQRGLQSLKVDWTYNDAELSLCAVATFPFGTFAESGDATPANVNKKVAPHFRRCALTRAAARVLRDALNCDMVALEELADE